MSKKSTLISEYSRAFPGRSPVVEGTAAEGAEVSAGRSRGSGVAGSAADEGLKSAERNSLGPRNFAPKMLHGQPVMH